MPRASHSSCLWPLLRPMFPGFRWPGEQEREVGIEGDHGCPPTHQQKVKKRLESPKHLVTKRTSWLRPLPLLCALAFAPPVFSGSFLGRGGQLSPCVISCLSSLDFSTGRKYFQGLVNRYYFGIRNHGLESLPRKRRNGAAVAKTLITSDPRVFLRSSEP